VFRPNLIESDGQILHYRRIVKWFDHPTNGFSMALNFNADGSLDTTFNNLEGNRFCAQVMQRG